MIRKFLTTTILVLGSVIGANALEITRWVAEGATGDGLSEGNPSGNLLNVLKLSQQVDYLTIYLAPGTYKLPELESADDQIKFKNVSLYGGWSKGETSDQRSKITGDLYINGGLVKNIDFVGSKIGNDYEGYLYGTLTLIGCNIYNSSATHLEMQLTPGKNYMTNVTAQSASAHPYNSGMYGCEVYINGCTFSNGSGLSVSASKVEISDCKFIMNKDNALSISGQNALNLIERCEFNRNSAGAISISGLDDDITTSIKDCVFNSNSTNKMGYSSCITAMTPVWVENCYFTGSSSNVKLGDPYHSEQNGAIDLRRSSTRYINCTFYRNNQPVIYYNMTPSDHANVGGNSFINCMFLENESPYFSSYGNLPLLQYCAADFGSEIPELDAEKHNIRINAETAKFKEITPSLIYLEEGSPLINAGRAILNNDIYGNSHQLLGGTDIGCVEYIGDWAKVSPESTLTIDNATYHKCKCEYNGKSYYALTQDNNFKESGAPAINKSLYLGDNLATPKVLNNTPNVISYYTISGTKYAALNNLANDVWTISTIKEYTTTLPIGKKTTKGWELVIPTATAKKSTTATKRPTSTKRR